MGRLSELWFRLTEKISAAIMSFIFFWGTLAYLGNIESKIVDYLEYLEYKTGNHGYFILELLVIIVSSVVDYILLVMPFSVIGMLLHGDKVVDKKRYILRFILYTIYFILAIFSRK